MLCGPASHSRRTTFYHPVKFDLHTSTNSSGRSGVKPIRLKIPDFFVSNTWRHKSQLSSFIPQVMPLLLLQTDGRTPSHTPGLRCYEYEQGHAPNDLDQLVPNYIQRVPSDPFSDRPLIYRPQGTDWLVYSVGEDGVDDGGKRVGRSVSGTVMRGDLFYDSPY
jgi:hypothetical protein